MPSLFFAAQATNPSNDTFNKDLILVLVFGVVALGILSGIYLSSKTRSLNVTYARIYGLVMVALLAVSVAFANLNNAVQTAAFTLLGTIAGYLAGATPTTVPARRDGVEPGGGSGGQLEGAQPSRVEPQHPMETVL